jgi:hypothetical protein
MTKTARLAAAVLALLLAAGAARQPPLPTPEADLMAVDRAFSRLSMEKGRDYAFLAYIAIDGRLYGTGNEPPVYGKAEAFRRLIRGKDSGTLSWAPETARVSADGKMGWTDGHWRYAAKGAKTASTGHYLTFWVRERRGWRVQATWVLPIRRQKNDRLKRCTPSTASPTCRRGCRFFP